MNAPRVVIGAPVYNHASEFREAIESILSQTYNDFHLVIVDDCSTDGTDALAREYTAGDARVEFVRNERRLGMIDNWRRAFEVSLEAVARRRVLCVGERSRRLASALAQPPCRGARRGTGSRAGLSAQQPHRSRQSADG